MPFCVLALFCSSVFRSLPGHAQTRTSKHLRPKTTPLWRRRGVQRLKMLSKDKIIHRTVMQDVTGTSISINVCLFPIHRSNIKTPSTQRLTSAKGEATLTLESRGSGWWGWACGSSLPCTNCCTWSSAGWSWFQTPTEKQEKNSSVYSLLVEVYTIMVKMLRVQFSNVNATLWSQCDRQQQKE